MEDEWIWVLGFGGRKREERERELELVPALVRRRAVGRERE